MKKMLAVLALCLATGLPAAAQYNVLGNYTISGNLGLGTQTPLARFHLNTGSTNSIRFRLQNGDPQGYIDFFNNDGVGGIITSSGTFPITVHQTGFVTIGSLTAAAQPLHLMSASASRLNYRMQNSEAAADLYTDGGALGFITGAQDRVIITGAGNVGIGTNTPTQKLQVVGTASVSVLEITGGADLSERFDVRTSDGSFASVTPGMVVSIDPAAPGKLLVSQSAYDRTVAGIVSGAGNVESGVLMGQAGSIANGQFPVALTGRVYVQADASMGAITPGDLLTTSDTPGHAMKVSDYNRSHGATLGKAMSGLESGKGLVLVLVSLQ